MPEYTLNRTKAINSLLHICNSLGGAWDMYSLLKILYFAECKHLLSYGRPITGDAIMAMKHGPVPSFAYDTVKAASINKKYFEFEDYIITAKTNADLTTLAESEIECLNASIEDNKHLGFGDLKHKSHQNKAYLDAKRDSLILYKDLACGEGANHDLLKYIQSKTEKDDLE
jgi:uncharacterized phage-associated protein